MSKVNPFKGPQPYNDGDDFFGRDKEIKDIYNLIRHENLTLLFARSGTGKTSLLKAGLIPILREEPSFLPVYIHLNESGVKRSLAKDLLDYVIKRCLEEITNYENNVGLVKKKVPQLNISNSLFEFINSLQIIQEEKNEDDSIEEYLVKPVLIFDQFEEIFTLPFDKNELHNLIYEINCLLENQIPKPLSKIFENINDKQLLFFKNNLLSKQKSFRIVFSFREEFLPHFESLGVDIPTIKLTNSRYRLEPFSKETAEQVIVSTAPEISNSFACLISENLVVNVSQNFEKVAVEPFLLSLVCQKIYFRVTDSTAFLEEDKRNVQVKELVDSAIKDYIIAIYNRISPRTQQFIETNLITSDNRRTLFNYYDATLDPEVKNDIDTLINDKELRLLNTEQFLDSVHIEILHDRLLPPIQRRREKREKREKEAALKAAVAAKEKELERESKLQRSELENKQRLLELEAKQREFDREAELKVIQLENKKRELELENQRREIETQNQIKQLEIENNRKQLELEKKDTRRKNRYRIGTSAIVLLVVFFAVGYLQTRHLYGENKARMYKLINDFTNSSEAKLAQIYEGNSGTFASFAEVYNYYKRISNQLKDDQRDHPEFIKLKESLDSLLILYFNKQPFYATFNAELALKLTPSYCADQTGKYIYCINADSISKINIETATIDAAVSLPKSTDSNTGRLPAPSIYTGTSISLNGNSPAQITNGPIAINHKNMAFIIGNSLYNYNIENGLRLISSEQIKVNRNTKVIYNDVHFSENGKYIIVSSNAYNFLGTETIQVFKSYATNSNEANLVTLENELLLNAVEGDNDELVLYTCSKTEAANKSVLEFPVSPINLKYFFNRKKIFHGKTTSTRLIIGNKNGCLGNPYRNELEPEGLEKSKFVMGADKKCLFYRDPKNSFWQILDFTRSNPFTATQVREEVVHPVSLLHLEGKKEIEVLGFGSSSLMKSSTVKQSAQTKPDSSSLVLIEVTDFMSKEKTIVKDAVTSGITINNIEPSGIKGFYYLSIYIRDSLYLGSYYSGVFDVKRGMIFVGGTNGGSGFLSSFLSGVGKVRNVIKLKQIENAVMILPDRNSSPAYFWYYNRNLSTDPERIKMWATKNITPIENKLFPKM